ARYEPKFRRDGARDTPRATIASSVSGKDLVSPSVLRSQRKTAGMGPGLILVLTPSRRPSQCYIWLVASFLLASTTGTTPWSPTCPPLPCRGSSLGLRRRSQGPRANMDRVVLEARSQSQAFRAEALLPRGRLLPRTG